MRTFVRVGREFPEKKKIILASGARCEIDETNISLLDENSARNGFGALTDELRVIVYVFFRQKRSVSRLEK